MLSMGLRRPLLQNATSKPCLAFTLHRTSNAKDLVTVVKRYINLYTKGVECQTHLITATTTTTTALRHYDTTTCQKAWNAYN